MTGTLTPRAPLRVLHVIPAVWAGSGGPSRAVVEMCTALRDADPTIGVDVATTDFRLTREARREIESRLPPGSRLVVLRASHWLDKGWSVGLARWLWKHAADYDVLHIHALFGSTSAVAAWIARSKSVPYVVRPLGTLSPYTFANRKLRLKRLWFRAIDRANVERASAVHFTAAQEASKAARLGLRMREVVIPLPYTRPVTTQAPVATPTILFLSRLHPVKGLDLLLPAFARVRSVIPAARLLIGGSGEPAYERWIDTQIGALGIAEAVERHGFVLGVKKEELLRRAAVFVLPSYQENFGVAVVEALAAGLPVIVTRHVDLWPDIEHEGSGVVIESTVDALTGAILALLGDAERRATMGAAAARHVAHRYGPAVVGAELARLYRGAAARSTMSGASPTTLAR